MKREDALLTLSAFVVISATIKFLLDGASINLGGQIYIFGHVDPSTYMTLLSPVLAAHSFLEHKKKEKADPVDYVSPQAGAVQQSSYKILKDKKNVNQS